MNSVLKNFSSAFILSGFGLTLSAFIGWRTTTSGSQLMGTLSAIVLCLTLGLLEISLSFDNAIVNASFLKKMTPVWQHRFLTWGMLIAVFGMRVIFPLLIVGLAAWVSPWQALVIAVHDPIKYAETMKLAHIPVSGFGGSFLLLVSLKHFFNSKKDIHWLRAIEAPLAKVGQIKSAELLFSLLIILTLAFILHARQPHETLHFLMAAGAGVAAHLLLDILVAFLKANVSHSAISSSRASAALFLYLEVQDASFSIDGVVGAFAITTNLFLIAIGLGIGAIYVRGLTLMLVERGSLAKYRYIESGAFYAIGSLAIGMLVDSFYEIPDALPGALSAAIITASYLSSVRHNSRN